MVPVRRQRSAAAEPPFWRHGVAIAIGLISAIAVVAGQKIHASIPPEADLRARPFRFPGPIDQRLRHIEEMRLREVRTRFHQGAAMLHLKQYEHAITAFHRVLSLSPRLPEAHVNMGYAYLGLRQPDAAQRYFASAVALAPNLANARYGLGLSLLELGQVEAGRTQLRRYLELAPAHDRFRDKAQTLLAEPPTPAGEAR